MFRVIYRDHDGNRLRTAPHSLEKCREIADYYENTLKCEIISIEECK